MAVVEALYINKTPAPPSLHIPSSSTWHFATWCLALARRGGGWTAPKRRGGREEGEKKRRGRKDWVKWGAYEQSHQ
jgi:hypothetical protein